MVRDDEIGPDRVPDAPIPDDQRPDDRELTVEQELLQLPGVQAAGLAGDRWLVHLRAGADPSVLPERIGDRPVDSVELAG